ncbi:outer membrane beta-barrel protein [Actibacterium sp. MT2.3-13A]|uniref:outer membrane protein n=1 Tax=Actibacterium sp. MT2.3-13A TaxID=2828332 RepID=UPI001BAB9CFA|nr:outer membrane beta-barrel protein [Actibacterium sp. MT2.3-13A]
MKHLRQSVLVPLLALGAATAAQAGGPAPAPAEPVVVAPAPAPVLSTDWTGFYAGLQLGFGQLDASGAATGDGDGVLGGVHAGYNWDFGSYVVGAELSYDASDIKLSGGAPKVDNLARIKLRAGADMGQSLVYGAVGAAWMDLSTPGAGSSDDNGWFLGAGMEHALRENVTLGGEILYHQFDNFSKTGVDYEVLTIQARVSFRF